LTIDDGNDNFTIKVDNVTSGSLSITQGTYADGESLAAELQARINGDATLAAAGARVNVTYNADHFEITSEEYGSGSNLEIVAVDTNTTAQLGFSVGAGTGGVDVAGSIGGVPALGTGQTLTGATSTGAEGMRLFVDGGALGARGTIDFSRGVSDQLNSLLTNFLQEDGILDARTDGIENRVGEIEDAREVLDRRMETLEISLRARFTVLDTLLSQLQNTSSFLTQQLASLPEPNSINRN